MSWENVLIWSFVLALVLLILGHLLRLLRKFIKFWIFAAILIIGLKLAADAGWITL
jgi:hypothetical protein